MKAELLGARARLEKAQVDVRVAEATLKVAESEERYAQAWVDYLTLNAPFPGVISARNANTFDFVQPTTGDPTAYYLSPDVSPSGTAAPIYVVDRLDIVRIFLDIPERDANFVNIGTKASVHARAFRDTELPATVTRTSWALNMKSRTLRAEVDLPNPDSQLLPGMYAYVKVIDRASGRPGAADEGTRPQRRADLLLALRERQGSEDRSRDGRQRRPVDRGHQSPAPGPPGGTQRLGTLDADRRQEQVILGDLSGLADGAPVDVAPATAETKLASDTPATDQKPNTRRSPGDARPPDTSRPAKRLP